LFRTEVEGTIMNVCSGCTEFGKVLGPVRTAVKQAKKQAPEPVARSEMVQVISEDYAKRISAARQRKGKTQKEFATLIKEKESVIQKLEQGQFEPSLRLARKLENHLRIKLVEQHEEKPQKFRSEKTQLTIGDMIELKD